MKRKTFILWKRIIIHIGIVMLIATPLFLYWKTGLFSIRAYAIEGVDEYRKELLVKKYKEFEAQKIFGILPGNSIFSYHRGAIKLLLQDMLPNASSVSIYPPSLHTLKIIVTSHTPILRKGVHQGITRDGVVYTEINDISSLPELVVASSSHVVPEVLSAIAGVYPKITAALFPVTQVYIDEHNDIHLRGGSAISEVIITSTDSMDTAWSTIVSAIDTEPLKSNLQAQKEDLVYLDVRFGNKVFYKFATGKTETLSQNNKNNYATSTASSTFR